MPELVEYKDLPVGSRFIILEQIEADHHSILIWTKKDDIPVSVGSSMRITYNIRGVSMLINNRHKVWKIA